MEQQKLPNSTLILIFGILSLVTCCCYGFIGLILGIIAIVLANKAAKVYAENPEAYTGYSNVKTGRILAIIGVVLSTIYIIYIIVMFSVIGYDGLMEKYNEVMQQIQQQ